MSALAASVAQALDERTFRIVDDGGRITHGSRQQPATEHTTGPHLGGPTSGVGERDLGGLGIEHAERELDDGGAPHSDPLLRRIHRFGAHTEAPDLAGGDEVVELLEEIRHDLVRTMQLQHVDVVRAEAAQASVHGGSQGCRREILLGV